MTDPPSSSASSIEGLNAERLLASALPGAPVSSPGFGWVPPPPEEIAPWFPDYTVMEIAGRGAMGAVYRAVHHKLDRPAAIKVLPASLASREGVVARFEREARTMARLNHPNIVTLYDFGRTAGGHLFIVMEYVEGADLSRMIHTSGLTVPRAVGIVSQVCDALHYAHERGFVHRDIKPGNVLVDTRGRVRIADFGLAKLLNDETENPAATLTGTVVGTPDYTAPEQLKGRTVDHRADIYSVGVMFYEMLTGDLPRGAWEPPSVRTSAAGTGLDEVVRRAMQTEPAKRYQQAGEMKAAVEAANRAPVAQTRSSPSPPLSGPESRRDSLPFIVPAVTAAAGAAMMSWGNSWYLAGMVVIGLALSLFFEISLRWRLEAGCALTGTLLGMILPPTPFGGFIAIDSLTLGLLFLVFLIVPFQLRHHPHLSLASLLLIVCLFSVFSARERMKRANRAHISGNPVPAGPSLVIVSRMPASGRESV